MIFPFARKAINRKRTIKSFLIITGGAALASIVINAGMVFAVRNYIYTDIAEVPPRTVVLVLGARVTGTRLSPILRDRVEGGIRLMESGKGEKLLLSGDHGRKDYNEVRAMMLYVRANAPFIQHQDIFMDHAGFSTWDSMYRARDVFEVKDLIIVTQGFHINRAVAIARSLGLDAVGYAVSEERFSRRTMRFLRFREYFARVKAFVSMVFRPRPRFLGDTIPITGDGRATWD